MGRGGSRYGAGRPGWRRKCEHMRSLDLRRLRPKGFLRPGSSFGWRWNWDGEPCGNIGAATRQSGLRVMYSWGSEGERQPYDYEIPLERTPCRFGGERIW